MRASQPDSALYYLGRMVASGEDPKFIARIDAIESKLAEFEDYFNTIESILTKIQAVYEAIKEQGSL
jgi:replication-associated recombination protein RarA